MKHKLQWLLAVLMLGSMLLGACAPAAQTTTEPTVEPTTPAVVEPTAVPTAVPTVPAVVTDEELDAAFSTFLADMEGYNTMTLEKLNEILITEKPFLLDVRTAAETEEKGHIEGSVAIPLNELGENLSYLPSYDTTIVSYCGSGWRCTIALTALEALGWENVLGLKGNSFAGWVDAGYPVVAGLPPAADELNAADPADPIEDRISEMLAAVPEGYGVMTGEQLNTAIVENPDLIVIDVRKASEIEELGAVDAPNLLQIPLEQFIEMRADWPADKDASIAIYCGSGHRSTIAMTILWTYGYTDVKSLKGGFTEYKAAGYATVGGKVDPEALLDAAYTTFLADMEGYNTLTLAKLNEMLIAEPPYLLDVRTAPETEEKGHIEGTVAIPLNLLGDNLSYLPSFDTTIVSYCGSGWRCTIALTVLEALGWENVLGLKENSFTGWVDAGYPVVAGMPPAAEALNAASPDPALAEVLGAVLANVPEGYGVITIDALNTELIENSDLIVIDVRTQAEIDEKGVIDAPNGVIQIPLEEIIAQKANWPADKDAQIVIYCGSGHRSTIAMTMLWSYGYTNVRSMKGGFTEWATAGYPVVPAE